MHLKEEQTDPFSTNSLIGIRLDRHELESRKCDPLPYITQPRQADGPH